MFQRSNIRRILRTFFQAAATCAAALSLTGANVHAQSPGRAFLTCRSRTRLVGERRYKSGKSGRH